MDSMQILAMALSEEMRGSGATRKALAPHDESHVDSEFVGSEEGAEEGEGLSVRDAMGPGSRTRRDPVICHAGSGVFQHHTPKGKNA